MKTKLIILTLTAIIASCATFDKKVDNIKLDSNGDTLEIVKYYHTDSIKEIIYYQNNRPVSNIGFYLDGDTIKKPYVVYSKLDNNMFVFIPYNKRISSYDVIFGVDSAFAADGKCTDKYHKLISGFHKKMRDLNKSTNITLDTAIINLGISKGVLKCKMDTAGQVYKYWGFDLYNKNYP